MSTDTHDLHADKRELVGKKVKQLREQDKIPATVYEKGKDSINAEMDYNTFYKVWQEVGYGQPVNLTVGDKKYLTMIKDVHVDPAKNRVLHAAFHAVNKNDPVEAEVSIRIEGDVPAEQKGNFIVRPNDHITIKALPGDLPEELVVSAEKLQEPGDQITVADIPAVANVEFISEPELVLATVEEPRVQEEEPEVTEEIDVANIPSAHGGDEPAEDTNK